jgi:hypothetical protein
MISAETLEAAVGRGIVSPEQAAGLRALAQEVDGRILAEPEDDEKLRFIAGFSDIFVTLGLVLFTSALGFFSSTAGEPAIWATLAIAAWLLAEFFTRRRRMALPSITLLTLFAVSVFGAANHLLLLLMTTVLKEPVQLRGGVLGRLGIDTGKPGLVTGAALMTAMLVALHYLRFRVPITVAAGAAALAGAALSILFALAPDFAQAQLNLVVLVLGIVVFALAMRFDLSDPARATRRTDIAFWLHLLAAPMVVHPLVAQFLAGGPPETRTAMAVLAIFVGLGVVAVAIDRRAMLVSGLAYAGYAFAALIQRAGLTDQTVPATFLALGAFVLLLSAGWRPIRTGLLKLFPARLSRNLPHPLVST